MASETDGPRDDDASNIRGAMTLSGLFLGLPPLLAVVAALWPGLVPLPFVAAEQPASMSPILLALAGALTLFNAGFMYLIYKKLTG